MNIGMSDYVQSFYVIVRLRVAHTLVTEKDWWRRFEYASKKT